MIWFNIYPILVVTAFNQMTKSCVKVIKLIVRVLLCIKEETVHLFNMASIPEASLVVM